MNDLPPLAEVPKTWLIHLIFSSWDYPGRWEAEEHAIFLEINTPFTYGWKRTLHSLFSLINLYRNATSLRKMMT
jgi:hypothetical protein